MSRIKLQECSIQFIYIFLHYIFIIYLQFLISPNIDSAANSYLLQAVNHKLFLNGIENSWLKKAFINCYMIEYY